MEHGYCMINWTCRNTLAFQLNWGCNKKFARDETNVRGGGKLMNCADKKEDDSPYSVSGKKNLFSCN